MSRDIIDNFFKIAQENGLISEDAPDKAKKALEKNPRADSLSTEDIAKLYNVKPDAPKGSQYKRNIIEDAHPTPVIISPSYDRLHGLVENENERQDIILNIINKVPNGHLTQHRYAQKELILSLVRVANDLDNQDSDQLRSLADACLLQISQKKYLKKVAVPALLIVIHELFGALYLQQHLPFVDEGFEANHQKLISEIDDILTSNSWGLCLGAEYTSNLKNMVLDLKNRVIGLYNTYQKYKSSIDELEKPKDAKTLLEASKQPKSNEIASAFTALQSMIKNMAPYLDQVRLNFSNNAYKSKQIKDKGWLHSLIDKTHIMEGGATSLVSDDLNDVIRAITPYENSISELVETLKNAGSVQEASQNKLQEALSKMKSLTTKTPAAEPNKANEEMGKLENDLGNGLEDFS